MTEETQRGDAFAYSHTARQRLGVNDNMDMTLGVSLCPCARDG
jgi:hypothetical protein